jgi:hypothetical protein
VSKRNNARQEADNPVARYRPSPTRQQPVRYHRKKNDAMHTRWCNRSALEEKQKHLLHVGESCVSLIYKLKEDSSMNAGRLVVLDDWIGFQGPLPVGASKTAGERPC